MGEMQSIIRLLLTGEFEQERAKTQLSFLSLELFSTRAMSRATGLSLCLTQRSP